MPITSGTVAWREVVGVVLVGTVGRVVGGAVVVVVMGTTVVGTVDVVGGVVGVVVVGGTVVVVVEVVDAAVVAGGDACGRTGDGDEVELNAPATASPRPARATTAVAAPTRSFLFTVRSPPPPRAADPPSRRLLGDETVVDGRPLRPAGAILGVITHPAARRVPDVVAARRHGTARSAERRLPGRPSKVPTTPSAPRLRPPWHLGDRPTWTLVRTLV
jgi:hypothetical protein